MGTVLLGDLKTDLFHELRMLLGAAEMCSLSEQIKLDQPINYFKDAAFVHARALYYFFLENPKDDDFSIRQLEQESLYSLFTSKLWKDLRFPLNKFVFHITESRAAQQPVSNIINGRHLNTYTPDIKCDVLRLWRKWMEGTKSKEPRSWLENSLNLAWQQAQDDYCISLQKIKEWK